MGTQTRQGSTEDPKTAPPQATTDQADALNTTTAAPQAAGMFFSDAQFAQLLQAVASRPPASEGGSVDPVLLSALQALQRQAEQTGILAQEVARTAGKSNAVGDDTGASAFAYVSTCEYCKKGEKHPGITLRPYAHPKAPLTRRVFFAHNLQRADQLTPTEIDLFNSFTVDRDVRGGWQDGKGTGWSAKISEGGKRLDILLPMATMDQRSDLPPLTQILLELLNGSEAADPANLIAQLVLQRERIERLEAALAAKGVTS